MGSTAPGGAKGEVGVGRKVPGVKLDGGGIGDEKGEGIILSY